MLSFSTVEAHLPFFGSLMSLMFLTSSWCPSFLDVSRFSLITGFFSLLISSHYTEPRVGFRRQNDSSNASIKSPTVVNRCILPQTTVRYAIENIIQEFVIGYRYPISQDYFLVDIYTERFCTSLFTRFEFSS